MRGGENVSKFKKSDYTYDAGKCRHDQTEYTDHDVSYLDELLRLSERF